MATLITTGTDTITPTVVLGYSAEREAGSIVHPILGRSNPDVTLRPAPLRTGMLQLGFAGTTSEADSKTAADLLATAAVFTLVSTDRGTVAMSFIANGRITRDLEEESRDAWVVSVGFHEVAAS